MQCGGGDQEFQRPLEPSSQQGNCSSSLSEQRKCNLDPCANTGAVEGRTVLQFGSTAVVINMSLPDLLAAVVDALMQFLQPAQPSRRLQGVLQSDVSKVLLSNTTVSGNLVDIGFVVYTRSQSAAERASQSLQSSEGGVELRAGLMSGVESRTGVKPTGIQAPDEFSIEVLKPTATPAEDGDSTALIASMVTLAVVLVAAGAGFAFWRMRDTKTKRRDTLNPLNAHHRNSSLAGAAGHNVEMTGRSSMIVNPVRRELA